MRGNHSRTKVTAFRELRHFFRGHLSAFEFQDSGAAARRDNNRRERDSLRVIEQRTTALEQAREKEQTVADARRTSLLHLACRGCLPAAGDGLEELVFEVVGCWVSGIGRFDAMDSYVRVAGERPPAV